MSFQAYIRDVPNFPKEGIVFKDITPLLKDSSKFKELIEVFYEQSKDLGITAIIGIESRGFIFGAALAYKLGAPFIPARKKGKLPYATISEDYAFEYGTDSIEMHKDAISSEDKVIIIDDLLATGGTCAALIQVIKQLGAEIVKMLFFIELSFLEGRKQLPNQNIFSVLEY